MMAEFTNGCKVKKGKFECPVCGFISVVDGKTEIKRTQFTRYMREESYPQFYTPEYIEHERPNLSTGPMLIDYGYQFLVPTGKGAWHFHWIPVATAKLIGFTKNG